MRYTTIALLATLSLISCTVDERKNQERVRLAEGYYNLGKYDLSITHSEKVPPNSKFFPSAISWNNKAHKADEEARRLGYHQTRIGNPNGLALRSPPGWEIKIPKPTNKQIQAEQGMAGQPAFSP